MPTCEDFTAALPALDFTVADSMVVDSMVVADASNRFLAVDSQNYFRAGSFKLAALFLTTVRAAFYFERSHIDSLQSQSAGR